eukprot:scaffold3532_cov182-Ochromonas_danica.AAC.2
MATKNIPNHSIQQSSRISFIIGLLTGAVLSALISFAVLHQNGSGWAVVANVDTTAVHLSTDNVQSSSSSGSSSTPSQTFLQTIKLKAESIFNGSLQSVKDLSSFSQFPSLNHTESTLSASQPVISSSSTSMLTTSSQTKILPSAGILKTANKTELAKEKEKCRLRYGQRKYLSDGEMRHPPMFYTFPGSGNTWGRLLLEYATGIYSGSVNVVKVHPHTHTFAELHGVKVPSDDGKCNKGNIKRFDRAILVLRDPFDSIWSEFQRRVSKSHVGGILRQEFDWRRWQANAASLSHYYFKMWAVEHAGIERVFKLEDYIYVKYEDLKHPKRRLKALQRMVDFLRLPPSIVKTEDRIACAFLLAENRHALRSVDRSKFMTKEIAYVPEIACRMWALFGKYASQHGYRPWANYNCTGYAKIPNINVGPSGELNHAVMPAQILTPERIANLTKTFNVFNGTSSDEERRKFRLEVARRKRETMLLRKQKLAEMDLQLAASRSPPEQATTNNINTNMIKKKAPPMKPRPNGVRPVGI